MLRFNISVPTDNGFAGRQCRNANCGRYFRVHAASFKDKAFCPYCGDQFDGNDLLTAEQRRYATQVATRKGMELAHKEIHKMLESAFGRNSSSSGLFKVTAKVSPLKPKFILAPRERKVDSELVCPSCSFRFQVYGIFGFCPGCRSENIRIYDANLEIIRQEVAQAAGKQRALRHAYGDLVSTFESFCRQKAKPLKKRTNFQNLQVAADYFREHSKIELFSLLTADEWLHLRRAFGRRHVHTHGKGIIDSKYVESVPEDGHLLNQKAELSLNEFELAAHALRKAIDKLVGATS
jgi:Zn finger protein HypA/HybF involved in hydrogenase expression